MARTRSAKGQIVDFDLLMIKQQMQKASPPTVAVKARENFIDKKFRRRVNTLKREPVIEQLEETVDVVPDIPGNDEPEAPLIDEGPITRLEDEGGPITVSRTKQKARK